MAENLIESEDAAKIKDKNDKHSVVAHAYSCMKRLTDPLDLCTDYSETWSHIENLEKRMNETTQSPTP